MGERGERLCGEYFAAAHSSAVRTKVRVKSILFRHVILYVLVLIYNSLIKYN